jgi:hypothetical protein
MRGLKSYKIPPHPNLLPHDVVEKEQEEIPSPIKKWEKVAAGRMRASKSI